MPDNKDGSSISNKTIWNLFIDHNNTLWISIYNVGIDLFEIGKGVTGASDLMRINPVL